LAFEQDPDYEYLRGLFKKIMSDNNYEYDYDFDWLKKSTSMSNYIQEKKR